MTLARRPTMWASLTLGILDLSRAHAWGTGEMARYEHVGILGVIPPPITAGLFALAGLAMLAAYLSMHCRIIGVSLTAGLHATVAISAAAAYLDPGSGVLLSTVGSYGAIAVLTLLITRMTDNITVLEGRPDGSR